MFDIGLDVHKENTYAVVLDDKTGQQVWEGNFPNTLRAAKETLSYYFVKGTRVALEATSCFYPLYDGLKKISDIEVSVVNTVKLEKPAVKTDRKDAYRIAHLLRRDELPVAYVPEHELRLQRELCSLRIRLVQACTRCKNRIHAILRKEGKRPFGVKDVFSQRGRKQLEKIKEVIARKEELEEELDLLGILEKKLHRIEKNIKKLVDKNKLLKKTVDLIDSIPGFAERLAYVCATEIGPISRFKFPHSLPAYAGLYPCIDSSAGKVKHGRMRRVGRKQLRWALMEAAHTAGRSKTPIGEYYRKKSKQKKSNHAAAVATANKLARIMYEVLTKQKPYDPTLKRGG
jgi:transposase